MLSHHLFAGTITCYRVHLCTVNVWVCTEEETLEVTYTHTHEIVVLGLYGMTDAEIKPILFCSCKDNSVRMYELPTFLERGRLFTRQEVRSFEIGPGGLFFIGDGTDVTPIQRREIGKPPRAWVPGKERVKRDYLRALQRTQYSFPFRVRYPGFQLQYWSLATLGHISSVLGTPSLLIDSAQKKQGSPLRSGCYTAFPWEGIYDNSPLCESLIKAHFAEMTSIQRDMLRVTFPDLKFRLLRTHAKCYHLILFLNGEASQAPVTFGFLHPSSLEEQLNLRYVPASLTTSVNQRKHLYSKQSNQAKQL
ncbi:hypothetical protein AHAS_Ahas14G0227600 [Arachis hypogaea]